MAGTSARRQCWEETLTVSSQGGKGGQGAVAFEESNQEAENCLDWRERLNLFVNTGGVPQLHLRAIPPVLGGRAGGDGAQGTGSSFSWALHTERERR